MRHEEEQQLALDIIKIIDNHLSKETLIQPNTDELYNMIFNKLVENKIKGTHPHTGWGYCDACSHLVPSENLSSCGGHIVCNYCSK